MWQVGHRATVHPPKSLLILATVFIIYLSSIFTSTLARADRAETDKQWMEWLQNPPTFSIELAKELQTRADDIVENITASSINNASVIGDLDMVISGGGNLDGFYMGVHMILSRINASDGPLSLSVRRWAGASAGGMMPFELLLRGETDILEEHISYAKMSEAFPDLYSNALSASALQDHHWRLMSQWMIDSRNVSDMATALDDRMYLALSCLTPLPKQVLVSKYVDKKQIQSAFMATGTVFEWYDDLPCSDGGAMAGKDMTPLFRDNLHPQIVVNLMKTDFPESIVFKYNISQAKALVEAGQDAAAAFVRCGVSNAACSTSALSFCKKGKATESQVCGV